MQRTFGKTQGSATKPQRVQLRRRGPVRAPVAPQPKRAISLGHASAFAALTLVSAGAALQWYASSSLDKNVLLVGGVAALLALHQLAKAFGFSFNNRGNDGGATEGDWLGISDASAGSDGGDGD